MKDSTLVAFHGYFYFSITVVLVVGFSIVGWEVRGFDQYLCAGAAVFGGAHLVAARYLTRRGR